MVRLERFKVKSEHTSMNEEEGKRAAVLNVLRQKFREITIRENDLRRKVADARSETITTRCVFLSIFSNHTLSQNRTHTKTQKTETRRFIWRAESRHVRTKLEI